MQIVFFVISDLSFFDTLDPWAFRAFWLMYLLQCSCRIVDSVAFQNKMAFHDFWWRFNVIEPLK